MQYHISRKVDCSFGEAREKATEALKTEGFGVLTEIDVAATMKQKLGEEFRPYVILGACNPQFAHRALTAEDKVGVLLPCNVVIQQHDDGSVEVSALAPQAMMEAIGNPALSELAGQVQQAMERVVGGL